ncbi:MAG: transposase [Phycisphaerae bacterium]
MGRPVRVTEPGLAYHVLNRRVMRLPLFQKDDDYLAFERVLAESLERPDAPNLLAWCLMPNHWHLVVHAGERTNLSTWMQWVTVTHTHRWHAHTHTAGEGPLYHGRFKSFPVQEDVHFLTVCRYVEANAQRAKLVKRAEAWRWGSLWVRRSGKSVLQRWLRPWPVDRPRNWLVDVNRLMNEEALQCVRQSITRGVPLGDEPWKAHVASRLGLDITLRPRGRPRKDMQKSS